MPATTTPIRVGVVADLTGPLAPMGTADANVARMVIDAVNADGGLLGREVELHVEDGATSEAAAEAAATRLVREAGVDLVLGGIFSSSRQAIKRAAVDDGHTLYIYPEQYEGGACDPLVFCSGPGPAQQVDTMIPWLMARTGARRFALPSADYVWPRVMNRRVRRVVEANGGEIVAEDYHALDHADYGETIDRIMSAGAEVVFNTTVPPGVLPFLEQLYGAGFTRGGGQLVCTYFDEICLSLVPPEHVEGLVSCLDYYQDVDDPFSRALLARYDELHSDGPPFTGGGASSGTYRGLKLWEAAVQEAGSLDPADVADALDHARLAVGPGGPAEMVPGQHHARMCMYIAQVRDGALGVVERLGMVDPAEQPVAAVR